MFDISALKEMKLSELQEIAKAAKTIKFNGVKKEVLINQILELQAKTTDSNSGSKPAEPKEEVEKPKRTRIIAPKKVAIQKNATNSLFAEEEIAIEPKVEPVKNEISVEVNPIEKKASKVIKFNKSAYEKKIALQKQKEEAKLASVGSESNEVSQANLEAETAENNEIEIPSKKVNPNQLNKQKNNQNPNQNANPNQNGNANQNGNGNANPNFKNKKNNFRDSDFEFDGIIESEGVLEMMPDGYGFLRSSIL